MCMRIGVIGTGKIAYTNVEALLKTNRAEIVAIYNRTLKNGQALAEKYSLDVPVYSNLTDMLDNNKIDVALINTPHSLHIKDFTLCANRGIDIIIEKPLGINYEECLEMIRLRDKNGIKATVCQTQRYLPHMRLALKIIEKNKEKLGKVQHVSDTLNMHYFTNIRSKWFFDKKLAGGGMLLTHGAHQIDRVFFLGARNVNRVLARLEPSKYLGIDGGYQIMASGNNTSFTVTCCGNPSPLTSNVQIDFEYGSIKIVLFSNGVEVEGVYLGDEYGYKKVDKLREEDAYLCQFTAMLDYLENKPSNAPTLEEAAEVVRMLDKAKQSSELSACVDF